VKFGKRDALLDRILDAVVKHHPVYTTSLYLKRTGSSLDTGCFMCVLSEDTHNTMRLFPSFVMDMRCFYCTVGTESYNIHSCAVHFLILSSLSVCPTNAHLTIH